MKTYTVKKITQDICLTGQGKDPQWKQAMKLEDFTYPWRAELAPKTIFRALWNDNHLFFFFHAFDEYIQSKKSKLEKLGPVDSDRVEIFFRANDQMNPYYSLEMDALGRILDTEGRFYRQIDFDWQWPAGHLEVKAGIEQDCYIVEGRISWESLRQLGMYQGGGLLQAGLYRGEYVWNDSGNVDTKWISWVIPHSEQPDFHIPSSFGILKLES